MTRLFPGLPSLIQSCFKRGYSFGKAATSFVIAPSAAASPPYSIVMWRAREPWRRGARTAEAETPAGSSSVMILLVSPKFP
jgi:hypothetical protein